MCETTYNDTVKYWKNKHATDSYSLIKTNKQRHLERTKYILDKFSAEMRECASICELGCGNGRNLHFIGLLHEKINLYGNDINPNLFKHIRQAYPDVLEKAYIENIDTLEFLKKITPVDMIFTYGHLMHLPNKIIKDVFSLIDEKVLKYMLLYEALPTKTTDEKQKQYDRYRWGRNYSEKNFPSFDLLSREELNNQCLYLFKRK